MTSLRLVKMNDKAVCFHRGLKSVPMRSSYDTAATGRFMSGWLRRGRRRERVDSEKLTGADSWIENWVNNWKPDNWWMKHNTAVHRAQRLNQEYWIKFFKLSAIVLFLMKQGFLKCLLWSCRFWCPLLNPACKSKNTSTCSQDCEILLLEFFSLKGCLRKVFLGLAAISSARVMQSGLKETIQITRRSLRLIHFLTAAVSSHM